MRRYQKFAGGTYLELGDYGFVGCRALCPDGKVRKMKRIAAVGDTHFSVPAAVRYKRTTVAGYVTTETIAGYSTPTEDDPAVVKFRPYKYRKNWGLFDDQ